MAACSSGRPTVTNVLPYMNAMPQTQDMTPHLPSQYDAQLYEIDVVVVSRKLGKNYRTNRVLNPGPVVCEFIRPTLSAASYPRLHGAKLFGS